MKNEKLQKLEELFILAKAKYYAGQPIITDEEFDDLEDVLRGLGSKVIDIVGTPDVVPIQKEKKQIRSLFDLEEKSDIKGKHNSKMLSLAKVKAVLDTEPPVDDALFWFKKLGVTSILGEPKYDGNAINIIYKKGKLSRALTRGDGVEGFDVTDKIKGMPNIPDTISLTQDTVEVRGEVVIDVNTFAKKYSNFKNPRNFVAGMLNRDDTAATILNDLEFMAFDARSYSPEMEYHDMDDIGKDGFTLPDFKFEIHTDDKQFPEKFNKLYSDFLSFRDRSNYLLDGFVLKTKAAERERIGETSHHPSWALALKFSPKNTITKIIDIEWKIGKTGEIFPVAILEPIDLDGATIGRASMYNAGWIMDNKAFPGSIVEISRKGDIIPGITKIIKESDEFN